MVQTGAGAYPLPSYNAPYSHSEGASSAPRRWGGVARRTGRGRAQMGGLGSREGHQGSFHPHEEPYDQDMREDFHQDFFPQAEGAECGFRPYADIHGQDMMEAFHGRQYQQRQDFQQQGFLTRMGPHSHVQHVPEEYGEPAHMHYGDARMDLETQYTGFKRSRPIATQQSETAEEFRFMLPEHSQVSTLHVMTILLLAQDPAWQRSIYSSDTSLTWWNFSPCGLAHPAEIAQFDCHKRTLPDMLSACSVAGLGTG